ncbi:MAG TPA: hypothetical protein VNL97_09265 [Solirubrobacterales bacterium]|nr:hypothetical protein [Solirubrobacterales bacterium]
MRDRYSLIVGLLFAAIIVIASIQTVNSDDNQILGLDELPHHWALPEFAIPDVDEHVEADANVAQDDCETARVPCPRDSRRSSACQVTTELHVLRVCEYFELSPLVLSFWFARGDNCVEQQDVVSKVYRRYAGRLHFISLAVGENRDTVAELTVEREWGMPIGYDRDGAVGSLYRVGGCPTFAYVYPGGTLQAASIGELTVPQLEAHVRELLRATRTASSSHPAR